MSHVLAPSVDGVLRTREYAPFAGLVLGASVGGTALGMALTIGALATSGLPQLRVGLFMATALVGLLGVTSPHIRALIPQRACQVDKAGIVRQTRVWGAINWGIQLGLGVRTFHATPLLIVFLAAAIASGTAWVSLVSGVLYGAVRGGSIGAIGTWVVWRTARGAECAREPCYDLLDRVRGATLTVICASMVAMPIGILS